MSAASLSKDIPHWALGGKFAEAKENIENIVREVAKVEARIALFQAFASLEDFDRADDLDEFKDFGDGDRATQRNALRLFLDGDQGPLITQLLHERRLLLHEADTLRDKKARLEDRFFCNSFKGFRVGFSTRSEVRACPFQGLLKLRLEAMDLSPRGTVSRTVGRDGMRFEVRFVIHETDLGRALGALRRVLDRVCDDLSVSVQEIVDQTVYLYSNFEEWMGLRVWADSHRDFPGCPMRAVAPTVVGERLEFDTEGNLSEDDFRRIAMVHGGKTENDLGVTKRSRTIDTDGSVSSGSARAHAQLFRGFGRDGPLVSQGMVAPGSLELREAHVVEGFMGHDEHFAAIIAILTAAGRHLGLPGADVDPAAAAEKAWWDLCAAGPRMELDTLTHGEYDKLSFYWAWNVQGKQSEGGEEEEEERRCAIHLARRDIEGKPIAPGVWPTWCVIPNFARVSPPCEKFVRALALRKHLTLALSGADRVLDVATFAQDWTAEQSTCWDSGGEPELSDHHPVALQA